MPSITLPLYRTRIYRSNSVRVRGATLAQLATATAMAAVIFGLVLHFQYAYGWSPVVAGLANLPFIVTMLAATSRTERLVARYGRRAACLVGAGALTVGMAWLAWAVDLVVTVLPLGAWSPELVSSYYHGERVAFLVLTVAVGAVALFGAVKLDDSRAA